MAEITSNISLKQLERFEKQYHKDPLNAAVEKAIATVGIDQAAQNHEVLKRHTFVFSHETKQGESTNQKKSGRCWYFASLNTLRQIVMEKLNVETFEFSETHLYFYDKLEKANTYLEEIIRTADRDLLDREVQLIMDATVYDGGFWEYFVPLCLKYGLVPKSEGPETFQSEDSYMMTKQMDLRLRHTAMKIRAAKAAGKSDAELRKIKDQALADVYNIAVKALGHPVKEFSFSYRDKDKNFHRMEKTTPLEFFEKVVGREELERRIVICCDPRRDKPVGRYIKIKNIRNVNESTPAGGYNIPLEVYADCVLASVKDGVPVWFACDVGKDIDRKKGILDNELFAYNTILPDTGDFDKEERFLCGYSSISHAMNITGVDLDEKGRPLTWRVDNSWGEENGKKGTFSMSHDWFLNYAFEAIIDKKYLPKKWHKGLSEEPLYLEPWDKMA